MKGSYLTLIAIPSILTVITMVFFKWEPSNLVSLPLFAAYLLFLRCFRYGPASEESFLSWRMRLASTVTVIIAFGFAAIIGVFSAPTSQQTFGQFLFNAFGGMAFTCLIGGSMMVWLVLFVPLFLISGATSIREVWQSSTAKLTSSDNSL